MKTVSSILFILAAILLFVFYTNPTYTSIDGIKAQISSYEEALVNAQKLREVRKQRIETYNKITPEQQQNLSKLVPDTVDNIKLIIDIDRIAQRYSLDIKNIRIDQGTADAKSGSASGGSATNGQLGQGVITLSFSVTASYERIMEFLKDLERSLRIVDVTSFGFASGPNNQYDFAITFKTYWLK